LFTAGVLAVICYAKIHGTGRHPWLTALRGLFVCCAVRVCSWHIAAVASLPILRPVSPHSGSSSAVLARPERRF
jgi:hypothetical protein